MNHLSTTLLAKHLNIDRENLVAYLLKRNLMQVHEGVWTLTEAGEKLGAKYGVANDGRRYIQWPETILRNRIFVQVCQQEGAQFEAEAKAKSEARDQERIDKFRQDLPGTYRTKDGHRVRSRAEVIIDNMLYDYGLVDAYERKVPIEEELYSDFYLPGGKIYLEY